MVYFNVAHATWHKSNEHQSVGGADWTVGISQPYRCGWRLQAREGYALWQELMPPLDGAWVSYLAAVEPVSV